MAVTVGDIIDVITSINWYTTLLESDAPLEFSDRIAVNNMLEGYKSVLLGVRTEWNSEFPKQN